MPVCDQRHAGVIPDYSASISGNSSGVGGGVSEFFF